MSLLLLFQGGGTAPSRNGSASAVAGASASAIGGKRIAASAAAVAGAAAQAVGSRNAFGTARAVAGGSARAVVSLRVSYGSAASVAGAYARSIGGKSVVVVHAGAIAGASVSQRTKPLRVGIPLSRLTRLVLALDPSDVTFTEQGADGPFPHLVAIGTLRIAVRAGTVSGIGSTESTSASATLDDIDGKVSSIIGRPVRVRADLYDHEDLFFSGLVTDISYGETISLTIQA